MADVKTTVDVNIKAKVDLSDLDKKLKGKKLTLEEGLDRSAVEALKGVTARPAPGPPGEATKVPSKQLSLLPAELKKSAKETSQAAAGQKAAAKEIREAAKELRTAARESKKTGEVILPKPLLPEYKAAPPETQRLSKSLESLLKSTFKSVKEDVERTGGALKILSQELISKPGKTGRGFGLGPGGKSFDLKIINVKELASALARETGKGKPEELMGRKVEDLIRELAQFRKVSLKDIEKQFAKVLSIPAIKTTAVGPTMETVTGATKIPQKFIQLEKGSEILARRLVGTAQGFEDLKKSSQAVSSVLRKEGKDRIEGLQKLFQQAREPFKKAALVKAVTAKEFAGKPEPKTAEDITSRRKAVSEFMKDLRKLPFDELSKRAADAGIGVTKILSSLNKLKTIDAYQIIQDALVNPTGRALRGMKAAFRESDIEGVLRRWNQAISQVTQQAPLVPPGQPLRGIAAKGVTKVITAAPEATMPLESKQFIVNLNEMVRDALGRLSATGKLPAGAPREISTYAGLSEQMASSIKSFGEGKVTVSLQEVDLRQFTAFGKLLQNAARSLSQRFQAVEVRGGEQPLLQTRAMAEAIGTGAAGAPTGRNVLAVAKDVAETWEDSMAFLKGGKLAAVTLNVQRVDIPAGATMEVAAGEELKTGQTIAKHIQDGVEKQTRYDREANKAIVTSIKDAVRIVSGKEVPYKEVHIREEFEARAGRKFGTVAMHKGVGVPVETIEAVKVPRTQEEMIKGLIQVKIESDGLTDELRELYKSVDETGNAFVVLRKMAELSGKSLAEAAKMFGLEKMVPKLEKIPRLLESALGVKGVEKVAPEQTIKGISALFEKRVGKKPFEYREPEVMFGAESISKRGVWPDIIEMEYNNLFGNIKSIVDDSENVLRLVESAWGKLGPAMGFPKGGLAGTKFMQVLKEPHATRPWGPGEVLGGARGQSFTVSALQAGAPGFGGLGGGYTKEILGYQAAGSEKGWELVKSLTMMDEAVRSRVLPTLNKVSALEIKAFPGRTVPKEEVRGTVFDPEKFAQAFALEVPARAGGREAEYIPGIAARPTRAEALTGEIMPVGEVSRRIENVIQAAQKVERVLAGEMPAGIENATELVEAGLNELRERVIKQARSGKIGEAMEGLREMARIVPKEAKVAPGRRYGAEFPEMPVREVIGEKLKGIPPEKMGKRIEHLALTLHGYLADTEKKIIADHEKDLKTERDRLRGAKGAEAGAIKKNIKKIESALASINEEGSERLIESEQVLSRGLSRLKVPVKEKALEKGFDQLEKARANLRESIGKATFGKKGALDISLFTRQMPAVFKEAVPAPVIKAPELVGAQKKMQQMLETATGSVRENIIKALDEIEKQIKAEAKASEMGAVSLRGEELGISEKTAREMATLAAKGNQKLAEKIFRDLMEGAIVQTTRFPVTHAGSFRPYKARVLRGEAGKMYEPTVAVPGIPRYAEKEFGVMTAPLRERQERLESARRKLYYKAEEVEEPKKERVLGKAAELTKRIDELARVIDSLKPRYIAHEQNLDFDGDQLMVHAVATQDAQRDLDVAFQRLYKDVGSASNVMMNFLGAIKKATPATKEALIGRYLKSPMAPAGIGGPPGELPRHPATKAQRQIDIVKNLAKLDVGMATEQISRLAEVVTSFTGLKPESLKQVDFSARLNELMRYNINQALKTKHGGGALMPLPEYQALPRFLATKGMGAELEVGGKPRVKGEYLKETFGGTFDELQRSLIKRFEGLSPEELTKEAAAFGIKAAGKKRKEVIEALRKATGFDAFFDQLYNVIRQQYKESFKRTFKQFAGTKEIGRVQKFFVGPGEKGLLERAQAGKVTGPPAESVLGRFISPAAIKKAAVGEEELERLAERQIGRYEETGRELPLRQIQRITSPLYRMRAEELGRGIPGIAKEWEVPEKEVPAEVTKALTYGGRGAGAVAKMAVDSISKFSDEVALVERLVGEKGQSFEEVTGYLEQQAAGLSGKELESFMKRFKITDVGDLLKRQLAPAAEEMGEGAEKGIELAVRQAMEQDIEAVDEARRNLIIQHLKSLRGKKEYFAAIGAPAQKRAAGIAGQVRAIEPGARIEGLVPTGPGGISRELPTKTQIERAQKEIDRAEAEARKADEAYQKYKAAEEAPALKQYELQRARKAQAIAKQRAALLEKEARPPGAPTFTAEEEAMVGAWKKAGEKAPPPEPPGVEEAPPSEPFDRLELLRKQLKSLGKGTLPAFSDELEKIEDIEVLPPDSLTNFTGNLKTLQKLAKREFARSGADLENLHPFIKKTLAEVAGGAQGMGQSLQVAVTGLLESGKINWKQAGTVWKKFYLTQIDVFIKELDSEFEQLKKVPKESAEGAEIKQRISNILNKATKKIQDTLIKRSTPFLEGYPGAIHGRAPLGGRAGAPLYAAMGLKEAEAKFPMGEYARELGDFLKKVDVSPIDKAKKLFLELTHLGEKNERVTESWQANLKETPLIITQLREQLEGYLRGYHNLDDVQRRNLQDTLQMVSQLQKSWGRMSKEQFKTAAIKPPTWLDPKQQELAVKDNIRKVKEQLARAGPGAMRPVTERIIDPSGQVIKHVIHRFKTLNQMVDKTTGKFKVVRVAYDDVLKSMAERGTLRQAFGRVIRWGSAAGIVYGTIRVFRQMITTLTQVERSIAELRKVMDPATSDFDKLRRAGFRFAEQYGVAIDSVFKSMVVFAQQGLKQVEVLERARVSILAENVTESMSAADATENLTAATKIFGREGKRAIDVLDAWSEVAAHHAVTTEVLARALRKAGSAAKASGVSFDEFNAVVTGVASVTRQTGQEIGTALRFIFSRIRREAAPAALARIGISTFLPTGEMKGAVKILDELAMKWKTLTGSQRLSTAQALAGARQYNALITLMENYDEKVKAQIDSATSAGAAMRRNAIVMDTLQKKAQQMGATWAKVATEFGYKFLGPAKAVADAARFMIGILDKIPTSVKAIGLAMLGIYSTIGRFDHMFYDAGTSVASTFGGALRYVGGLFGKLEPAVEGGARKLRIFNAATVMTATSSAGLAGIFEKTGFFVLALGRKFNATAASMLRFVGATSAANAMLSAATAGSAGLLASLGPLAIAIAAISAAVIGTVYVYKKYKETGEDIAKSMEKQIAIQKNAVKIWSKQTEALGAYNLKIGELNNLREAGASLSEEEKRGKIMAGAFRSSALAADELRESMFNFIQAAVYNMPEAVDYVDEYGRTILRAGINLGGLSKRAAVANKELLAMSKIKVAEAYAGDVFGKMVLGFLPKPGIIDKVEKAAVEYNEILERFVFEPERYRKQLSEAAAVVNEGRAELATAAATLFRTLKDIPKGLSLEFLARAINREDLRKAFQAQAQLEGLSRDDWRGIMLRFLWGRAGVAGVKETVEETKGSFMDTYKGLGKVMREASERILPGDILFVTSEIAEKYKIGLNMTRAAIGEHGKLVFEAFTTEMGKTITLSGEQLRNQVTEVFSGTEMKKVLSQNLRLVKNILTGAGVGITFPGEIDLGVKFKSELSLGVRLAEAFPVDWDRLYNQVKRYRDIISQLEPEIMAEAAKSFVNLSEETRQALRKLQNTIAENAAIFRFRSAIEEIKIASEEAARSLRYAIIEEKNRNRYLSETTAGLAAFLPALQAPQIRRPTEMTGAELAFLGRPRLREVQEQLSFERKRREDLVKELNAREKALGDLEEFFVQFREFRPAGAVGVGRRERIEEAFHKAMEKQKRELLAKQTADGKLTVAELKVQEGYQELTNKKLDMSISIEQSQHEELKLIRATLMEDAPAQEKFRKAIEAREYASTRSIKELAGEFRKAYKEAKPVRPEMAVAGPAVPYVPGEELTWERVSPELEKIGKGLFEYYRRLQSHVKSDYKDLDDYINKELGRLKATKPELKKTIDPIRNLYPSLMKLARAIEVEGFKLPDLSKPIKDLNKMLAEQLKLIPKEIIGKGFDIEYLLTAADLEGGIKEVGKSIHESLVESFKKTSYLRLETELANFYKQIGDSLRQVDIQENVARLGRDINTYITGAMKGLPEFPGEPGFLGPRRFEMSAAQRLYADQPELYTRLKDLETRRQQLAGVLNTISEGISSATTDIAMAEDLLAEETDPLRYAAISTEIDRLNDMLSINRDKYSEVRSEVDSVNSELEKFGPQLQKALDMENLRKQFEDFAFDLQKFQHMFEISTESIDKAMARHPLTEWTERQFGEPLFATRFERETSRLEKEYKERGERVPAEERRQLKWQQRESVRQYKQQKELDQLSDQYQRGRQVMETLWDHQKRFGLDLSGLMGELEYDLEHAGDVIQTFAGPKFRGIPFLEDLSTKLKKLDVSMDPLLDPTITTAQNTGEMVELQKALLNQAAGFALPADVLTKFMTAAPAKKSYGGFIEGPGTETSDSIRMNLRPGDFVLNAAAARGNKNFLNEYFNGKTTAMQQGGIVPVDVSRGEFVIPEEKVKEKGKSFWEKLNRGIKEFSKRRDAESIKVAGVRMKYGGFIPGLADGGELDMRKVWEDTIRHTVATYTAFLPGFKPLSDMLKEPELVRTVGAKSFWEQLRWHVGENVEQYPGFGLVGDWIKDAGNLAEFMKLPLSEQLESYSHEMISGGMLGLIGGAGKYGPRMMESIKATIKKVNFKNIWNKVKSIIPEKHEISPISKRISPQEQLSLGLREQVLEKGLTRKEVREILREFKDDPVKLLTKEEVRSFIKEYPEFGFGTPIKPIRGRYGTHGAWESPETISRLAAEKAKGTKYVEIDVHSGRIVREIPSFEQGRVDIPSLSRRNAIVKIVPGGKVEDYNFAGRLTDLQKSTIQRTIEAGGYKRGTKYVPEDMVAQLHKGEEVVPASVARMQRGGEVTVAGFGGEDLAQTIRYAIKDAIESSELAIDQTATKDAIREAFDDVEVSLAGVKDGTLKLDATDLRNMTDSLGAKQADLMEDIAQNYNLIEQMQRSLDVLDLDDLSEGLKNELMTQVTSLQSKLNVVDNSMKEHVGTTITEVHAAAATFGRFDSEITALNDEIFKLKQMIAAAERKASSAAASAQALR